MNEYDIGAAFEAIENELIRSMIRNMDRHRAEEIREGYDWSMWQAEQLKTLEKYKQLNQKRYGKQFKVLNREIELLIREAKNKGSMKQEVRILQAIRKGFKVQGFNKSPPYKSMTAEFFKLNNLKLEALIKATTHDMEKAETAVLRMANDQYRKAIFNAQVYANTGAGTYEKAVDMATKDMLSRGLNCVEYKNGARHTLRDYADMAIRTASKRAYLQGEGEKRQEWGVSTVIVNKRGNPCPKCLPFCGKVFIDDVWSGGSKGDGPYPLISKAIAKGLYHPRCKDAHTTYFPGVSTADDTWTADELEAIGRTNKQEARQQYAKRQTDKFMRLAKYSLDDDNKKKYKKKAAEWSNVLQSDIMEASDTKEVAQVHSVGKIDKNIYKCVTKDIVTDEVIITDNQLKHILDRHPDAYEKALGSLKNILESPNFIIEDKHKNTGLVIGRMETEDEHMQVVLRLCAQGDDPGYKNSIISCWKISEKRLQNYLRNKQILYKKE